MAWATLAASVGVTLFIGIDRWILQAWLYVGLVLVALTILGRMLAKEIRGRDVDRPARTSPRNRLVWIASGVAAFLSCTLAAGLVRSGDGLLVDYWLLGALMVLSVVLARLAYHGQRWGVDHNR